MGFNDISLYNGGAGDGTLMTPNIDALAHEGVTFTNGYAANAVCAPSRASIMTGRYSTRFGFEFTPFPRIGATIFSWMEELDPLQIVGSVFLTPDPGIPTFANACWVEDDCLTIPENPALIGLMVYLQAAAPVAPDWALSNRVDLLIGTQF